MTEFCLILKELLASNSFTTRHFVMVHSDSSIIYGGVEPVEEWKWNF